MKLRTLLAGTAVSLLAVPAIAADAPAALVVAQGGLGDGAWNDTANAGFEAGIEATGIEGRAIESNDVVAQGEEIMRRAADAGFGLILSLEYAHGDAMQNVAADYPDANWAIYNQVRTGDNIASASTASTPNRSLASSRRSRARASTSSSWASSRARNR